MSEIIDSLVYDRTQADVTARNAKGTYNYTDLNRVNSAVEYLADEAVDMLSSIQAYLASKGVATDAIFEPYTEANVDVELPVIEGSESRLPDGYTELEYIESSGAQYIDTGFTVSAQNFSGLRVVQDCELITGGSYWSVNGISGTGNIFYLGASNTNAIYYGNGASNIATGHSYPGGRIVFDLNVQNSSYTFGETILTGLSFSAPSASANFYIFAYNTISSRDCHSEKIYNLKIFSDDELVRNFVPCENPSGEIGLYDLVNDVFYQNAGSGTFSAGPEIDISGPLRTTWERGDIPYPVQMAQYLANVTNLRGLLPMPETTPAVPDSMENLTYSGANDIEKILSDVDAVRLEWEENAENQIDYIGTYANQLISGTFYAGGYRTLQHFSRGR